jgi:chromosome segregation protein
LFKLKRVELLGFKSFADRTHLDFGDGTAAVVGPNGCGKSNLSDAISWVLGEQSARMLRGERMADVIFNGTGARPATSMAEVSLTLVDPEYVEAPELLASRAEDAPAGESSPVAAACGDVSTECESGAAPEGTGAEAADQSREAGHRPSRHGASSRAGEIRVTRRLFRSGESEYLLNNETCRLRDIQDLFMGTGLGPESYAIIEQGRIGQILSSKPSDRRAIIEEAAGVSKFKSRKRLAEAKLESARQNLARINDILEEVTKQVNSLKRQASKARRYRELHEELRGRMKVVLTSRFISLESECQRLRDELTTVQSACAEAAQQVEGLEQEQTSAGAHQEQLDDELNHLRESLAQGDLEQERLRSRIAQLGQHAAGLGARSADALRESQRLREQLDAVEREAALRAQTSGQTHQEWAAAQETVLRLLERQNQLSTQLSSGESTTEACRRDLLAAVSRAAELRNQLVQAEEVSVSLERQLARTQAEAGSIEQEHAQMEADLEVLRADQLRNEGTLTALGQSVSDVSSTLEQVGMEEARRRAEVEGLRQDFSQAYARRQALEESLARHAYSTESVRRLLSGSMATNRHQPYPDGSVPTGSAEVSGFRPLGVLADFVEVSAGYEEVVEEFLKTELDCVVVERHEEARQGIAMLQNEGTGRSTFFVTQFPTNGHAIGHVNPDACGENGVVASLRELVRFEPRLGLNGGSPLPALESAYLVEDAAAAERLAAEYPTSHFLTPKGEHYHHRLVSGGKVTSAGPLALRREFRQLEHRAVELETELRGAEAALNGITARAAHLDEELRGLSAARLEAEKKAAVANEKLRQTDEGARRATERLGVLREETRALEIDRQSVGERHLTLTSQLEVVAAEQVQREQEISCAAQQVRDVRAELDQSSRDLAEAQARCSALEERAQAIETEKSRLKTEVEGIRAHLEQLEGQFQSWRDERARLEAERDSTTAHLAELEADQGSRREQLQSLERESQAGRARRDQLRPLVDAARAELDRRREMRSEVEVAQARADSDLAHHAQQCRQELSLDPAALVAEVSPENILKGELLRAAEEESHDLKSRIDNLGPINMMALEELQEGEERMEFLETQRKDLLDSISDTTQTIREIDQVSHRQFLEAFKAVNEYFAESFRTLFGGGIGEMRFNDEADPESGIDLVAQPPGKRLQNVLLLSGGEKALAALALLIAVFRFTPSPFCVLDEVDAPLDDSNVERFTRMIRHMSRHTQFILITHNKRTMEICSMLYGVTMEEPGVSKLVSVRFEQAVAST